MTERVTVVTGAGSGIGAATARLLTAQGHRLVLCGRRATPLQALADELGAIAVVGDACTESGAAAAVAAAVDEHGRLDGLVLNAGLMVPGSAGTLTHAEWDSSFSTNVTGPFLLVAAALPALCEAGAGAIVGVASISALRSGPRMAAYAASKAALVALIQSIAFDYAEHGVRANTVSPGWVRTEMSDMEMDDVARDHGITKDQAYTLATSLVPQRRAADPEEAAAAIAWLLNPEASYVTGSNLVVDGGTSLVDAGTVPLTNH